MPDFDRLRPLGALCVFALLAPLTLAACGDDDDEGPSAPTKMSVTTRDLGKKKFEMDAPASIEGGAVELTFTNAGKVPHEAQLIRLDDGHTAKEAVKAVSGDKVVIPEWFHAEGGVSTTPPGGTNTATVKLPPGNYGIIDTGDEGPPPSAFGAIAEFKVDGENDADVPEADAKIEGKDRGEDEYEWTTSNLKAGNNEVTFDNQSEEIHHVVAFPMRSGATLPEVKKALSDDGRPAGPPPVDFEKGVNTSVLDGKRKETTRLKLASGRYALICFLTDRDGEGKSHYENGMLEEVDVQ